MHTVRRAGRAAASAARVVSRASPSSERRPNAAIPSIAIAASSSSLKSLGAPFIGAAAARRARWFAAPADAASSQPPAATSANDSPTSSSSLASQLRAGLDYELRNRCPNARGKQYDDFQQFLLSHLSRLSAAVGASGGGVNESALVAELAAIAQDARRYAAMDPAHRDGLLRRLGSVLHQSQQRAAQTQQTREAPRAWQPPSRDTSTTRAPEPKQRASSAAQRRAAMDAAPAPAMTSTPGRLRSYPQTTRRHRPRLRPRVPGGGGGGGEHPAVGGSVRRGVRPGDDGFEQGPQPDHRNRSGEFLFNVCMGNWYDGMFFLGERFGSVAFADVNARQPRAIRSSTARRGTHGYHQRDGQRTGRAVVSTRGGVVPGIHRRSSAVSVFLLIFVIARLD